MSGDFCQPVKRVSKQAEPRNVLGPALKEIRLSRKWTLKQMADRLRSEGLIYSEKRLERIESQQVAIRDFEVFCFCALFGVTQEELWKQRASLLPK